MRVTRGLAAAGILCALLAVLVVLDRTGVAPSVFRSARSDHADIIVFAIAVVGAALAVVVPHRPRRRRWIFTTATLVGLPVALGPWALLVAGFAGAVICLARASMIPLVARLALAVLAWVVVPVLRVAVLDVALQAETIFLALVWAGLLYAACYLIVERERTLPAERSRPIDDAFYLLAPPRLVAPFFQPISPRELWKSEKRNYPPRALGRAAWLGAYAVILAVASHHLGRLHGALAFPAAYARFASGIITAIAVFRLLGFDLPPGFRFPFLSRSFAEFYRRFNHYVRDAVLSLFYFPLLGHLRHRMPERAASIVSSYVAIIVGSLALHDLLVPAAISPQPLVTLADYLRPQRILGLVILWSLIVVPTAGIAPRRELPRPRWRVIAQIAAVNIIYIALWYLGER